MAEELVQNQTVQNNDDEEWEYEDVNIPAETSQAKNDNDDEEWEYEDVNIPNYTTLDADTGEVYSVPATMDETDTRFAIATQHENVGKENFIGKIQLPNFTTPKWAELRQKNIEKSGDVKEVAKDVKGFFSTTKQAPGAAAAGAYDIGTSTWQGQLDKWVDYYALSEYAETGKNEKYKGFANTPSIGMKELTVPGEISTAVDEARAEIMKAEDIEFSMNPVSEYFGGKQYTEEDLETARANAKELSNKAVKLIDEWRSMNQERWEKTSNELYPMEMRGQKDIASLFYGIGNGGASIAATIAMTVATKNPTIAAVLMGKMFFDTEKSSAFQEAKAMGEDFYAADWHSDVLGFVEGGLEGLGDWVLMGLGKFATTSGFSKVMKRGAVTAVEKVLAKPNVSAPVKNAIRVVARKSSVFKAGLKGAASEGFLEETPQNVISDYFKNAIGWQDKSDADIWTDALWNGMSASITGLGAAAGGSALYNRKMSKWNNELKTVIKKENPNLSEADAQKAADLLQESYLQEGAPVIEELNNMLAKEKDVDALPDEGLNIKSIGEVTRNMMKERFGVTDEEIDNWVNVMLPMIDARNQYNEAYQGFYDQLTDAGRDEKLADREARIIAARATTLAIVRKQSVGDILNRWKLRIEGDQTKINMPGEDSAELDAIEVEPATQDELNLLQKDIDRLKRGVSAKKKAKGTRLAQFIVQNGGIADDRGDIKAMGSMPGLLNKKGISLDEAARMAWDAGYITGTERPDVNQLLDLLSDDLGNKPVYTENDQLKGDSNDYYRSLEDAIDRAGVDIEKDSIEEIDRKLKVYRKRLAAWEQLGRDEEQNIASDEDLPFWQEARKLAEDIDPINPDTIRQFSNEVKIEFNKIKEGKKSSGKIGFGKVKNWLENISKKFGLNIDGFKHIVDVNGLIHVNNRHGKGNEGRLGQMEITSEDVAKVAEIVSQPDFLVYGRKSDRGLDTIGYIKQYEDGGIYYVEEVWNRKKELAAKTMYKKEGGEAADEFISSLIHTPEATPSTATIVPVSNKSISNDRGKVNTFWQSAVVRDLFDTQGDLFEQPQSKQTQTAQQSQQAKQLPAEAQKQVDDLFAYAEKQEGVKKEAPLFSDKKETQKIEKSYTASDNQKIVDVGDKLLGNLKRDTRVLSWEELEKMNDLLRAKNLTKANIYPKPSIEELRAQGLDGRPAAVVMYVYNSINAKPSKSVNPTIENQKRYFNVVKRTMDNTIEYAKTHKDEIENWQRSMSWNEDLLRMVFPSEEKTVGKIFRENREYNTEVAIAGGNKFANGMLISGYDLAELDKIAAGFEQEASEEKQSKASQTKEPWQRYFTVGKTYGGQYIVVDRNGKTISRDLTFDTVEKAVEFATKAYEIIKPHLKGEGETVDFSNMRNKGLQRRENNQNVNAQALIDTFGFRGINFGNWTKQSERQDFLNLTYDSLFDMAEILGIPAKAIGLEGKLGLAFGAQGHAGAVGHFIPAYNEINLTRKYGAGSLAHEWWHALDYYFGDQANQKDYSGVPSLELKEGGALRSETFEAIKNLYETISTTELTDEELKERAKKRYDSLKYIVDYRANELKNKFAKEKNAEEIAKFIDELVAQDKNFDASKRQEYTEKFSEMIPERRRTWENAGIFTDLTFKLQSIHDLEESQQSWRKSSEFYENARKLDKLENKSYWTQRTELGARAFASYIDDKIANRDWYNYFLSGHAKLQIFDDKSYLRDWADAQEKNTTVDVNDYRIPIYPANTVEQANINAAFDNLFNTIKVDESKDFRLYQSANAPARQDTARPQGARGSFTRRADTGEAIIELFETADASTIIHELGHFFLDDMKRFADDPTTAEQLQAIYKYVGSLDGNLSVEQHEYFARSFEAYIREGRSPNSTLKKVFDNFRTWLRNIYKTITGLNVDLDDNIRQVFDEMLGGRQLDFALQRGSQNLQTKLQRGFISAWNINKAMQLLHDGKMSKADMQELINELKAGKMEGKDFGEALKKFERNNNIHKERLTEWDYNYFRTQLDNLNFKRDQVKDKILRLLDWTKPRSRGGKLVGRFPNKNLNDAFDHFRELANMNKDEAQEKIDKNQEVLDLYYKEGGDIDAEQLIFDNKLLSLATGRISDDALLELYEALSDSYNEGRLTDKITGEIKKARKERMINEAKEVLTDAGRINWHIEDRGLKAWVQKQLRNFGRSQMSWSGLLDMLSINDRSSKTGQSLLSKNLDMFEAEQVMYAGVAQDGENISTRLEKALSGSANKAISVNRYINKELNKEVTIEWTGNENLNNPGLKPKPFMIRKTFTKDKLIDIYMKSKDEDTLEIMNYDEIHQYNDEFLAKVEAELTEDDIAVANALFDFYNDNYDRFNKFYEDHFGISLAHNKYYSPRSVTTTGIDVKDGSPRAYASFSGAKQRTAGKGSTINIKGAFAALNQYVQDLNHYIGYADKLQDINAVMGNKDIKEIIDNVFGGSMNARIKYEIENMANSGADKGKLGSRFWNGVRSRYAKSVLAVKPSLAIKQLTSFPAYWENMSTVDFVSGVADFFKHPKEAMKILGNTTLMKTRGTNIIRDFEVMSKTETFKNMKKSAGKIKWDDLLMANIKFGDRGAIYIGGWALYKAELKKNLAAGMSEAEAKAAALNRFERVTDETQQSGRLSQQSYMQSNSAYRAFTMFTSSQNQYLRKELNAIRGLVSGRMGKKQVAKTIFIYHFLLPMFFQAVSDGFRWDKDAQLRTAALGSLNGWFILNKVLENIYNKVTGQASMFKANMTVRELVPFWGSIEDIYKDMEKLLDGDIEAEDVIKSIKTIGELTGLPLKYGTDVALNAGDYASEGEYGKEGLLWLGWSPYSLRDFNE